MEDILVDILVNTRREVSERKERTPVAGLKARALEAPAVRDFTEALLALPVIFRNDLGACNMDEMRPALAGNGLCNQGLTGAWGAIEEDALGWLDSQFLEEFRVPERELDRLAEALELVL